MTQPKSSQSELDDLRGWASVGKSGCCVHSFFAPRRGQPCAGCLVRESQRALGMLLDTLEKGVESPSHGLEIESREDAIRKARWIYEMVKEGQDA